MLVTSGCWPQQGGTPENSNLNSVESLLTPDTLGRLPRNWTAPGVLDAVIGNRVIGADATGADKIGPGAVAHVRSLDTVTGHLQWQNQVLPDGFVQLAPAGPAAIDGNNQIVVAVSGGSLFVEADDPTSPLQTITAFALPS